MIIHDLSAPLLFGQSAIERLGKIQLENDELIIIQAQSHSSGNNCSEAINQINKAEKYYVDGLYNLSVDAFEKAYEFCPDTLSCFNLQLFGNALYNCRSYSLAIKYLEMAKPCTVDEVSLFHNHLCLGYAYGYIGDTQNAIINTEKSITYAKTDIDLSFCYSQLGSITFDQNTQVSFNYYEKSIGHLLKYENTTIQQVGKGYVKNDFLGELLFNQAVLYRKKGLEKYSDNNMILSALCGYPNAVEYCRKLGLNYESYMDRARKDL